MQNVPQQYGQQPGYSPQGAMVQAPQAGMLPPNLMAPKFLVQQPWLQFLGRKFWVYGPDGAIVAFVKHPIFKLRQEFTIFADEGQTTPFLFVKARSVIGFNICNDVFDPQTGAKVGTIRRRGLASILRDTWDLLDPMDQPVGLMQEDSIALLRRLFPIIPGKWHVELGGQEVCRITQQFTFFSKKFDLDVSMGQGRMDPRFAIACTIFALMQEKARQGG
jgi:uncharacterized protein YxjI